MKQIMKRKTIWIGILGVFLFSLQAYSAFDRRESRQQTATEKTKFHDTFRSMDAGSGSGDAGAGTNGIGLDPPGDGPGTGEKPTPIGDAAGVVLVLGLAYGVYCSKRKKPIQLFTY
jgi:hypothetical protein